MQFLVLVVAPLACLVALISYVWLTVIAFKKSPGWGLLVLLLSPFSAIAFAIKYWQESKKPFLLHAGCIATLVMIAYSAFSAIGGFEFLETARKFEAGEISEEEIPNIMLSQLERLEKSGLMSEDDKVKLREVRAEIARLQAEQQQQETHAASATPVATYEDVRPRASAEDELPPIDTAGSLWSKPGGTPIAADRPLRQHGGNVRVGEAEQYVGSAFTIVIKNGQTFRGRLTEARPDRLVFERSVSGGEMQFEIGRREIDTLKLRSY